MYFFCALLIAGQLWAQEPSLPAGLGGSEPSLPQGLGSESGEERSENHSVESWKEKLPFELSGFMDTRWGHRLRSDPLQDPISIAEFRLHHELEKDWKEVHVKYSADFLYDPVWDAVDLNLNSGTSWFDLREAHAVFRPFRFMDIKIGRQILTWGTGDLIFINDLFPKDWVSFFVGRDLVYLKAPSDAIKLALFSDVANLDIIYTPQFDSDRYISGQRISFYSQGAHSLQGQNAPISVQDQEQWFSDDEISIRLYRSIKASTIALYYYRGFWKSPAGFEPNLGKYTFPELSVYGASVRGPFANGIAYVEGGYYDSMKDREGTNPLIRNSELRVLGGYEKEIFEETTLGVQYYLEHMSHHKEYAQAFSQADYGDENRHLLTFRINKFLLQQNMQVSLFYFLGLSDQDGFVKLSTSYTFNDHMQAELGTQIFYGKNTYSFFGQFEQASNAYGSMKYSF